MKFSLKDSFNQHSKNYSERVMDRKSWANLSCEDSLVIEIIDEMRRNGKTLEIIDAGCGTGDRLRYILESAHLDRSKIKSTYGLDYADSMLAIAREQKYLDKPLYDKLTTVDLTSEPGTYTGNLVLCLWGILNGITENRASIFSNLAKQCVSDGVVIFDILTAKALKVLREREATLLKDRSDLEPFTDNNTLWYARNDATIGYMKLFTINELNNFISNAGLRYKKVWGYNHKDLNPHIVVENSITVPEQAERDFSVLFCVVSH